MGDVGEWEEEGERVRERARWSSVGRSSIGDGGDCCCKVSAETTRMESGGGIQECVVLGGQDGTFPWRRNLNYQGWERICPRRCGVFGGGWREDCGEASDRSEQRGAESEKRDNALAENATLKERTMSPCRHVTSTTAPTTITPLFLFFSLPMQHPPGAPRGM